MEVLGFRTRPIRRALVQLVPLHGSIFFHDHTDLETLRDKNYVHMKLNMSQENHNWAFLSQFPASSDILTFFVMEDAGTMIRSQSSDELEDGKRSSQRLFKKFLERLAAKTNP